MRSQDPTPYYIRTEEGDCYYEDNLDDAIRQFVSVDGYRLTLKATDGTEVVIRLEAHDHAVLSPGNDVYGANITVRRPGAKKEEL